MKQLHYTCNLSTKSILPGSRIVFIPYSYEIYTETGQQTEGEDFNPLAIPFEACFYGVNTTSFEPITIPASVGEFRLIDVDVEHKNKVWKFMQALSQHTVISQDDAIRIQEVLNTVSCIETLKQACKESKEGLKSYPWIALMKACDKIEVDEKIIQQECQDDIVQQFIHNLYYGVAYMGQVRGKPSLCKMKLSTFAEPNINIIKNTRIQFGNGTDFNFAEFTNFILNRYCLDSEIEQETDKEILALALSRKFLNLHKFMENPIHSTFIHTTLPQHLHDIKKSLLNSDDIFKKINSLIENICLVEFLKNFNIQPKAMQIIENPDKHDSKSVNYRELMQNLTH